MSELAKMPGAVSSTSRVAPRLRIIAIAVLALGIAAAELVYWHGTRAAELPDDPSLLQNEKAISRQAGILYGNQAALVQSWSDELKRPGVQATIIVVTAALLAAGCFYFARLIENDAARQVVSR